MQSRKIHQITALLEVILANIWTKSLFILYTVYTYKNCYSGTTVRSNMDSANFTDLPMIGLNHSILEVINSRMPWY